MQHLSVPSNPFLGFLSLELNLAARARDPFLNFLSATLNISLHGDFSHTMGGKTLQSVIKWTPPHEENQRTSLIDLNPEILARIFDNLDICTSTCLALSNTTFYSIFRSRYPAKISLWECCYEPDFRITSTLGDLLEPWFGPRYRRRIWTMYSILQEHAYTVPQFLLNETYGAKEGIKDDILAHRYLDHFLSRQDFHGTRDVIYILPKPYGMGDRWYHEAYEAIKRDALMINGREGWSWGSWMDFWDTFEVFGRLGYMEKLKVLQWFEEADARRILEMRWKKLLWLILSLALCLAWLRRIIRFIARGVGKVPERTPIPRPRTGQRQGRGEKGDGMV